MAADIVNLRHVRKAKTRVAKEATAAANRAKFGRTKADRLREAADLDRARAALDGLQLDGHLNVHQREPVGSDDEPSA